MEQENIVVPDATTEIPAPELADTPEIAAPEAEQQPEQSPDKPEDESQRAIRRMERRINAKHAQAAAAEERARMYSQELAQTRERLAQYEQPQEQPQHQQPDPFALAELISHKRDIDRRSNTVAEDGKKRFPDFNSALQEVAAEAGPLFDERRHGLPTPLGEAILESEDPAAVLHYLGTNPDVAAELRDLTPVQVARRLARIEVQMLAPKEPKTSTAPKPVTPLRGNSRDSGALADDLPLDEWAKRFNKQRFGR